MTEGRAPNQSSASPKGIFSGEVDLTRSFSLPPSPRSSSGHPFDTARLLVRVGGEPIGFVTLSLQDEPLNRAAVLDAVERDLGELVAIELAGQDLPALRALREPETGRRLSNGLGAEMNDGTSVTVIVCTRDRAEILCGCLDSLTKLRHDAVEFVIVDNAPSDGRTRSLVAKAEADDSRFRYVVEPLPGLSRARNCGLRHATSEIVAYTDDDVRVDPLWIRGILRGFRRRPDIGCVTGLVASASLELAAERYFDARVWWSSSCDHHVYDAAHRDQAGPGLYPYAAGAFGTGANFAFHSTTLREIGGFDEALGAGSPSAGGEDLDIFVRTIHAGRAISYEPAALVWHEHRADHDDLRRQMYAYGKGLSAYLFKYASSRQTALDLLRRLPIGIRHLARLGFRATGAGRNTGSARGLLMAEMRGWAAGPFAYLVARRGQDPRNMHDVAP